MKLQHLIIFILCLLCFACKKEIDIEYRQVDPLYVVESSVTNHGMKARISMTNNMDDNNTKSDINHATVVGQYGHQSAPQLHGRMPRLFLGL